MKKFNIDNIKDLVKSNFYLTIISDHLMSISGWNFENEYEIANYLDPQCPKILDIGGHKGESIKNFLKFKPNASIISIEPNPILAQKIKNTFKNNKKIKIINKAVSLEKSLTLHVPKVKFYQFTGLSSTSQKLTSDRLAHYFQFVGERVSFVTYKVIGIKIDSLNEKPDLMKIDTEGTEFDVLKSSISTLKKSKPILIIEFNRFFYKKINAFLKKIGYVAYRYKNHGEIEKISIKNFEEISRRKNLTNIVYITKENIILTKLKLTDHLI
jgi:FkbM family methyltransferase